MWFESMKFAICCILSHVTLTSNNIIVLILQNVFAFVGFFCLVLEVFLLLATTLFSMELPLVNLLPCALQEGHSEVT